MLNEGRSLIGLFSHIFQFYESYLTLMINDKESSIIVHIIKMDSANAILNWRILSLSKSSRLHVIQRLFFSLYGTKISKIGPCYPEKIEFLEFLEHVIQAIRKNS